jgi:hypothetical protein
MREWHIEHMEKTIIKFVTGLSANANSWHIIVSAIYILLMSNLKFD